MLADIVKIHCLTHHANFPMSRTSRIVVCKEGADEHTLSDNFPYTGSWIYCCNCQTFVAWEIGRASVSIKQCPFCHSSLNPRLYVCDHCAVTMLDFDDQTLRKHHTVLNWGMPQPACPACHQFPGSTPKQHFCRVLQVNVATARPSCTFCGFKTDEAPLDGNKSAADKFGAALAEAEARVRDAEERSRLAEDAVRKEIELRVRAERKAEEIEKKVTGELSLPPGIRRELAGRDDVFAAFAEAEAKVRTEAGHRAYTEVIERREAERRIPAGEARAAGERQRLNDERRKQANAATGANGNGLAIAIYAGTAVILFIMLILILYALIRAL
ncbi:MAG TPA: hypothetical protein VJ810_27165 [Blastocatellia bacterium]|nr:hypothetical protein [Blastocatellia bacterium]